MCCHPSVTYVLIPFRGEGDARCANPVGTSPEIWGSSERPDGFEPFILSCLRLCRKSLTGPENPRQTLWDSVPRSWRIWSGHSRETFCPARTRVWSCIDQRFYGPRKGRDRDRS